MRTVVVTGGSRGVGLAACERFANAGDRVIALARDAETLNKLDYETYVCDVTDERAVIETFKTIGVVDVLVNNAGYVESAPLTNTTLESWGRHLDVNVTGPFLCMRAVVDGMRERERGAIVTVASTAARVGTAYTSAYTASKHAVVGLTRAVAAELTGTGIRVNAVCPTYVDSDMTRRSVARIVEATGRTPDEIEQALTGSSPLGRMLAPGEVADAIVFLASPAAAAINGQALVIDGGGIQA